MSRLILSFLLFFAPCNAEIDKLITKVIATYPHEASSFTQGLISENGTVYESSGLYKKSFLKKYELKTGKLLKLIELPVNYFAEGISLVDNELIQLTWKEQTAFIYDPQTFQLKRKISYQGEGWGLCQDGKSIWMSNGTSQLFKRDPQTFEIQKIITVSDGSTEYGFLNDLVCVDDYLFVNVFGKEQILRIDKNQGEVTGIINAATLLTRGQKKFLPTDAVLNGIAYRKESQTFLITGKRWPHLFEVIFQKEDQ